MAEANARALSGKLSISLFAVMLAAAGLPLYVHLPRYASAELGLSLGTVGAILIGIRLFDFAQDPAIGWLVDRFEQSRGLFAALAAFGIGAGFVMLFSTRPPVAPTLWLVVALLVLFSAYSLGAILFYGQTVAFADDESDAAIYAVAGWREGGLLVGIILAASAPALLVALGAGSGGYAAFGWLLAGVALLVGLTTRSLWRHAPGRGAPLSLAGLRQAGGIRLLVLALVNSLPVAITSTLFLFFVEDKLRLGALSGPLLILFFLAAGLSVPLWTGLSARHGARRVLLPAMVLAIFSFIGAAMLPAGAAVGFAVICLASGAAVGADMVILPALFSSALNRAGLKAGQAFGLWNFATKFALALAAITALPLLDLAGFRPGIENDAGALATLTFAYAVLPCLLKLAAIGLVLTLPDTPGGEKK